MAASRCRNPLTRLLLFALGSVGVVIAAEIVTLSLAGRAPTGDTAISLANEPAVSALPAPAPRFEFDDAVNRSLFAADRKPKEPAKQLVLSNLAERWALTGVVDTGDKRFALFTSVGGDKPQRLKLQPGESLEQWRIAGIEPNLVNLTNAAGAQEVLPLKDTPIEALQSQVRIEAIRAQGLSGNLDPARMMETMRDASPEQRRALIQQLRDQFQRGELQIPEQFRNRMQDNGMPPGANGFPGGGNFGPQPGPGNFPQQGQGGFGGWSGGPPGGAGNGFGPGR
ncbi:MAG: hypothetical protein IT494_07990 [Gammaproteobacteria bacterium]|nr:hypothetical protein [Gammaproteobacteria bacterium]